MKCSAVILGLIAVASASSTNEPQQRRRGGALGIHARQSTNARNEQQGVRQGRRYFASSDPLSFHAAERFCRQNGGRLAHIRRENAEGAVAALRRQRARTGWIQSWEGKQYGRTVLTRRGTNGYTITPNFRGGRHHAICAVRRCGERSRSSSTRYLSSSSWAWSTTETSTDNNYDPPRSHRNPRRRHRKCSSSSSSSSSSCSSSSSSSSSCSSSSSSCSSSSSSCSSWSSSDCCFDPCCPPCFDPCCPPPCFDPCCFDPCHRRKRRHGRRRRHHKKRCCFPPPWAFGPGPYFGPGPFGGGPGFEEGGFVAGGV